MTTRCLPIALALMLLFGCSSSDLANPDTEPNASPRPFALVDVAADARAPDSGPVAGPVDTNTGEVGPVDVGPQVTDTQVTDTQVTDTQVTDTQPEDAQPQEVGGEDATVDSGPVLPVCGDGVCDDGESPEGCPEDCEVLCDGQACPLSAMVYVAPDGDDAEAGTHDAPWGTVQRALDYIASGPPLLVGGLIVWIRGGTYFIDAPIVVTAAHSGTSDSPVLLKAYPGEEPIFIGGRVVTGWTLDSGQVYKAQLAEVADGTWRFDQLFENGARQTKARHPNSGYLRTDAPTNTPMLSFQFKAGEVPNWGDYEGAQASIWATANWFENIVPISSIAFGARTITVDKPLRQKNVAEDRYFIQGVKAALDVPGEFYLNEATGELFYWPMTTPIEDQQIVVPTVKNVFHFLGEGDTDRVEHVTLEGLTIWGSLFTNAYRSGGYATGPQASGNRPGEEDREGLVQMESASHITVRNCTLYNAGHCGVNMGYYASHNTIEGNAISDCGSYGVLMVGKDNGEGVVDDPSEQVYDNKFHTLYNNHIHHCGVLAGDTAGIYLYQSGDNDIAHNLIHGMPRYGIGMKGHGGLYGKYTTFGNVTITDDNYWDFYTGNHNTIRHNHVYDLLEDSYDAGGISLRRSGLHNVIDHNRIHAVNPPSGMDYHFSFGIYLDGGTSYTDITNNVIYDIGTNGVGYPIKMKKVHNTVTNNILVLKAGTNGTLAMQEGGGGQPEGAGFGYHTVTRNILYAKGEAAVLYWFKSEEEFDCDLVGTSDYNLFFLPDGGPYTFQSIPGADNFANWKTLCGGAYDQNTVTKDPLFVDVDGDDYNIAPNSPAYDIGFVEIDQGLAGLVGTDYVLVDHLEATPGGATGEIDLSWRPVSGATGYTIKRSMTSGAGFSAINTSGSPGFTDAGLGLGTRYYYKVSAIIDGQDAPNSREVSTSPGTVLFSDDFESGGLSGWMHADWGVVTGNKHGGTYAARADVDSGYLFKAVDISGYSAVTLSFYYREVGVDDDDQTFLRFYDGADHDPIFEVGNTAPEGTWHLYSKTIENSGTEAKYFHSGFQFRWTMGYLDEGERVWIDDVVLSAQ